MPRNERNRNDTKLNTVEAFFPPSVFATIIHDCLIGAIWPRVSLFIFFKFQINVLFSPTWSPRQSRPRSIPWKNGMLQKRIPHRTGDTWQTAINPVGQIGCCLSWDDPLLNTGMCLGTDLSLHVLRNRPPSPHPSWLLNASSKDGCLISRNNSHDLKRLRVCHVSLRNQKHVFALHLRARKFAHCDSAVGCWVDVFPHANSDLADTSLAKERSADSTPDFYSCQRYHLIINQTHGHLTSSNFCKLSSKCRSPLTLTPSMATHDFQSAASSNL